MKEIKDITIIFISYHSQKKLKKIIAKIPRNIKIIIVDNSKDFFLRKTFKNKKNIKIYYNNNDLWNKIRNNLIDIRGKNKWGNVAKDLLTKI